MTTTQPPPSSHTLLARHEGVSGAFPVTSVALVASGDPGLRPEPRHRVHLSPDMRPRLPDARLMQLAPHTVEPEAPHHAE
jgi:hypothetical protein